MPARAVLDEAGLNLGAQRSAEISGVPLVIRV